MCSAIYFKPITAKHTELLKQVIGSTPTLFFAISCCLSYQCFSLTDKLSELR